MSEKIISVTHLRPKLLEHVGRASKYGQEFIITKNGEPSAVMLGYEEWLSWKETIEILSDPALVKKIRKGQKYFKKGGKGKSIEEAFK